MADDKLPCCRSESIAQTKSDKVVCRPVAIFFSAPQNSSSRLTLVLWPARTTDLLITSDFITHPRLLSCGDIQTNNLCRTMTAAKKLPSVVKIPQPCAVHAPVAVKPSSPKDNSALRSLCDSGTGLKGSCWPDCRACHTSPSATGSLCPPRGALMQIALDSRRARRMMGYHLTGTGLE
jgi:hypothetical protein